MAGLDGLQFDSYESLAAFVRTKENKDFIQLFVADSRTIEAAQNKRVKRNMNPKLKYYEITYKCIHSGHRKSVSKGKRPAQSTFRQNCPFIMRLRVSLDGNTLNVISSVDDHNHPHNEETYSLLPRQRQLDAPTAEMAKHMIRLRGNKKLLQAEILMTNKKVTLKDLHNLKTAKGDDSLETCLNYLLKKECSTVEILKNSDNVFLGLFYQDREMQRVFNSFPEILFIDAIYKVSNLRILLYIFAVEDSNGGTEIVGFFLAASEDAATVNCMVEIFKKYNPAWEKTRAVMTDKDFEEMSAFKKGFPNAHSYICLFHVLRTFRREINCAKMKITPGIRTMCLELAQKFAYAKNIEEYDENLKVLEDLNVPDFKEYFLKNWNPIRDEWVPALQRSVTLGNRTNNRLEAMNQKVMQVVERHSRLPDLFMKLDDLMLSLRTERDSRAANVQLKVPLNIKFFHNDQKLFMKVLTPYAYGMICDKFDLMKKVKAINGQDHSQDELQIYSKCGILKVTNYSGCSFYSTTKLPCHHIFFVRELKGMSLFSESLIPQRWTKSYYLVNSRLTETRVPAESSTLSETTLPVKKIMSQHEKFRVVMTKFQKIASLASEAPSRTFPQRLAALDQIINLWENNVEIHVLPVEHEQTPEEEDQRIQVIYVQPVQHEPAEEEDQIIETIYVQPVRHDQPAEEQDQRIDAIYVQPKGNDQPTEEQDQIIETIYVQPVGHDQPSEEQDQRIDAIYVQPKGNDQPAEEQDQIIETIYVQPVGHDQPSEEQDQRIDAIYVQPKGNDQPTEEQDQRIEKILEEQMEDKDAKTISFDNNERRNGPLECNVRDEPISLGPQLDKHFLSGYNMKNLPTMPPKMKKRGRPKGRDVTVVGLPVKKRNVEKPVTFEKKGFRERNLKMLQWFVSEVIAEDALDNEKLITELEVEVDPVKVPSSCLDPNINLQGIRQYFSEDGWLAVDNIYQVKKNSPAWLCPVCSSNSEEGSILCNSCLSWYHLKCSGLSHVPKSKNWFCRDCYGSKSRD